MSHAIAAMLLRGGQQSQGAYSRSGRPGMGARRITFGIALRRGDVQRVARMAK
jgi:hypothetical protein